MRKYMDLNKEMSMDQVLEEDLEKIVEDNRINIEFYRNKTFLITGATGLIAYNLIHLLLYMNDAKSLNIKVIALVRNRQKAVHQYGERRDIIYMEGDITKSICLEDQVDFVVHAASQTSSKAFISDPIGVIDTTIQGTKNVLEYTTQNSILGMVYLSTMEIYGAQKTDEKMRESHATNLDTMVVRSSYPESKRMAECLCTAYASQYHIPVKIMRLSQTFGPGVNYNDERVFAEFARCVIEGHDIILHTKGETTRNYLYTADAATAILKVLEKGETGTAYNTTNEDIYCSIREMADLFCKESDDEIGLLFELESDACHGYAPVLKSNLDTAKLKSLGWKAEYNMPDMIHRLCESMRKNR